jgi:hypothetical protein
LDLRHVHRYEADPLHPVQPAMKRAPMVNHFTCRAIRRQL